MTDKWTATGYSDPRVAVTIDDWPFGRKKRGVASFYVECDPRRGERAVRVTNGKPKKLTYAARVRIVTGDDGRTYLAELSSSATHVAIMRGDMRYQHETIFPGDVRYPEICALLNVPVDGELYEVG